MSYWEHWLIRIQYRIICPASCRLSAIKFRRVREAKGGQEEGRWRKIEKMLREETKVTLKLSNFRHHRNYFRDFSTKLQINAAKNTCDQTHSDKGPFNYILKTILNTKIKIWNTNELLDACWNKGSTESNSTRLVNISCLIENID